MGRLAAAPDAPVGELRAGQHLEVGAVAADVWWPAREIDAGSVANNGSVVLTLHVGGVSFLLAGDIEREAAAAVLREVAAGPRSGGAPSTCSRWRTTARATATTACSTTSSGRLALISVGEGNDYGHPTPSTLAALEARGFEVHRTDLEGDLAVVTDGDEVRAVSG